LSTKKKIFVIIKVRCQEEHMSEGLAVCGRLAPSPTGRIHLGNAWAFLCAWLGARSQKGELVLRIEDIDPQRSREEYIEALYEDLLWLGLVWNGSPERQSGRLGRYSEALSRLERQGLVYPCFCTRKELREMAGAPQAGVAAEPVYSGRCAALDQAAAKAAKLKGEPYSLRLRFPESARARHLALNDLCLGPLLLALEDAGGDFPLCRSDGVFAYQLAVVLDDIDMGVTQVVRGQDILTSTPRQRYLYELFNAVPPEYAHIPLLLDHEGERLAKRHAALSIAHLREAGVRPQEIVGWLAFWSGLRQSAAPLAPMELLRGFSFGNIRQDVPRLPERLAQLFPALA
jgi:glutamyl-tRNA synthetase